MTENSNISDISTYTTSIEKKTGITNIANGVTNNSVAELIIKRYSDKPNHHTKLIRSSIESLLNCQINERVNNQYMFFRWDMPCISEVADGLVKSEESITQLMKHGMTVADPKDIEKWIVEVMVCTTKQSALTEKDMALKARVYAGKLSHIPADILRYSCEQICLKSKFFPSLAEIYEFVQPLLYYRKSLVESVSQQLISAKGY